MRLRLESWRCGREMGTSAFLLALPVLPLLLMVGGFQGRMARGRLVVKPAAEGVLSHLEMPFFRLMLLTEEPSEPEVPDWD